jgi:hypothetical protein
MPATATSPNCVPFPTTFCVLSFRWVVTPFSKLLSTNPKPCPCRHHTLWSLSYKDPATSHFSFFLLHPPTPSQPQPPKPTFTNNPPQPLTTQQNGPHQAGKYPFCILLLFDATVLSLHPRRDRVYAKIYGRVASRLAFLNFTDASITDRPQVYWRKGSSQAVRQQGCPQVRPVHRWW